ncbi:MAG TPA: ferritin-like domain-containing protein [Acidimicrobiales bacterium]|nr:ferritin-like domain-containing protein [Acidimicrobiales bacterium]
MSTDTDTLIRRSARLDTDDIDFGAFGQHPLDPDALRSLRYMHDIENHTMCYLRDVLVTRAHRDPEITAFLSCWSYEEHWHGDAIARVLRSHGEPAGAPRVGWLREALPRRDAWRPLMFSVGSALTRHVVAVHMAWGAVNELTTQTGYGRLSAKAGHPVLSELLRRIMRQEGRHIDFYGAQAKRRLAESPAARRLTRYALRRFWAPVGSGVMPETEVRFLARYLFDDDAGMTAAQRVDRQIDRLPGLEGLHLLEGAVRQGAAA